MLKNNVKNIFATVLVASIVIGCFTATAAAVQMPTSTAAASPIGVTYSAHVQNKGWLPSVSDGKTAGTTGLSLRLESLKASLTNAPEGTGIQYSVYVQDKGWTSTSVNGDIAGTVGESKRVEAIKINLTGLAGFTVEYRVHVQNIGWMDWQRDGAVAGTTAQGLRLEAIEIRILPPPTSDNPVLPQAIDITSAGVTGFLAPISNTYPILLASLVPDSSQYTVTSLSWSPTLNVNGQFSPSTEYDATIVLTSASGYKFPTAGIASPTVDGGVIVNIGATYGGDVSGNTLMFIVNCPETLPEPMGPGGPPV